MRLATRSGLLLLVLTLSACGDCGGSSPSVNNGGSNNGGSNNGTSNNGTTGHSNNGTNTGSNNGMTNNGTTNNGTTNNGTTTGQPPTQASQLCAGAAVSTGGGFTATSCLGPAPVSGGESSGSGFVWKPSATFVITE